MRKRFMAIAALFTLLSAAALGQDAKTVIATASKAMGADVLNTVEYSASGSDFTLGQAYSPDSAWPRFIVKSYTRAIDFRVPASRADRIRLQAENPPRGGGQQPVRGEQPQSQTIIVNANTPWAQQLEIWMTPHGFLRAAAANNATVRTQTGGRRVNVISFTGPNKAQVNGYVSDQNLVERVETWIDNAYLGDMHVEALYTEYRDFAGVKFPMRIVQRQGGHPILDLTVSDVRPNAAVTIQAPQGRGGAPAGAAAPAAQPSGTPSEKLAEGVYLILGGYASLAFDFKDHIVVVEGPQSEQRALDVIAEAKRLIPNKPIRYVVNTHHHIDHASGLRAFVAEGATIVTHQVNRAWYEKIFALPHTLNPDRLSASNRRPAFETMTDKKVMTDGNHVIELHHLRDSGHNAGLIMVYLPRQKILLQADAFNPPAQADAPVPTPVSPYVANLATTLNRLKLDVERIIPVHYPADGRQVMRAELMRMVGQGTN